MSLIRVGLWRVSLWGGNLLAKDLRALFFDETSQVFKASVEMLVLAVVLEVAITALCESAHKDFLDLGVALELVEWDIAFEGEAWGESGEKLGVLFEGLGEIFANIFVKFIAYHGVFESKENLMIFA